MSANTLVIIDPQYSFCHPQGELFVPGADADMERVANFIEGNISLLDEIIITKDNHPRFHIGFPSFWTSKSGMSPMPFSILSLTYDEKSILDQNGNEFYPELCGDYEILLVKRYLKTVGKHIVWPYHCLQNTIGNSIVEPINSALYLWEKIHKKPPIILCKGEKPLVEEYSIVQPEDKTHDPNWYFLSNLKKSKTVFWSGEALSHCVKKSIIDSYHACSDSNKNWFLIKDTSSPVTGFEKEAEELIKFCVNNNINFTDHTLKL